MKRGSSFDRNLDRWVGIPLVRASALARKRPMPPRESVRRVGVLTSTTIGDTLLASAAVQRVKNIWPQAELIFFADGNRAAAELLPAIHRIESVCIARPWKSFGTLRRERLDVMVDFSGWQRVTALLAARSGAKFVAGFERRGQHRHYAFDFTVEHRGDRHESENFAAMASALEELSGAPHSDAPLALRGDVFDMPLDARWYGAVVFHCWATGRNRELREWPEPRWRELAALLREEWGRARADSSASLRNDNQEMKLVLTAGAEDLKRARELAATLGASVFDAPGGLAAVAVLLRQAKLVVSVNTGTMHLAAITGAPLVAINGPNANARWGPRGSRVVGVDAPGAGCGYLDLGWEWERDPSRAGAPTCMERTSVDDVMRGIHTVLAARG